MEPTAEPDVLAEPDPKTLPPRRLFRGRPGRILLTALIVEIVLIAAVGNQSVSKSLTKYLNDHKTAADYKRGAAQSLLTFHWRFAPASGEPTHTWAAQLAGILVLLVLTGLLGWAVSRGSVTFGRIWVSIGAIVAAVTPIAVMVANVIIEPNTPGPGESRLGQAIYGYPAYGPVIVAGLGLGVVVGLFAALLAIITRKPIRLPVAAEAPMGDVPLNAYGVPTPGYEPPPWQDDTPTAYVPQVEPMVPAAEMAAAVPLADQPTAYVPQVQENPAEVTAVVPVVETSSDDVATQPPTPPETLSEDQRSDDQDDDLEHLAHLDAELPPPPGEAASDEPLP